MGVDPFSKFYLIMFSSFICEVVHFVLFQLIVGDVASIKHSLLLSLKNFLKLGFFQLKLSI